jgi:hypothetical protein
MTVNTQELRELLEKATPGKWVADGKAVSSDHGHRTSICGTYGIAWPCGSYSNAEADAALIAAARNALPALLAEIDALRVRVAQLAENDTYETEYERNAEDAARWRYIRRKLCLTGNGDGTCAMQAINLPAAIQGWPEPEQVAEFCDAAIDTAMSKEGKQ